MTRSRTFAQVFSIGAMVFVVGCGGKIDESAISGGPGAGTPPAGGGTSASSPAPGSSSTGGSSGTGPSPTPTPNPHPPPVPTPIACGASTCDAASQQCCVMGGGLGGGPGGPPSGMCVPTGKCAGDVTLSCSSAVSCTMGNVCCINLNADMPTSMCQASCGGGGGGGGNGGRVQLCESDKECTNGRSCREIPDGVKICMRGGN
jgi:hypothetical protein